MFSAATFPASMARLHPARNNLRARDNVDAEDWPTPIYNGDIAADATPLPTSQYLQSITDTHAEYRNASLLLKVWAKQRKYHTIVGLSHVHLLLSLILAYLVSGDCTGLPRAPPGSSAWQLFKRTLGVISAYSRSLTYFSIWTDALSQCSRSQATWASASAPWSPSTA